MKAKINKDLENEIMNYAKAVARKTAGMIRDELTEIAKDAIDAFYSDYDPKFYRRHFYNFKEKSFRKYYSNPHNKVYTGGVELTPNLLDEIYSDDADEVFDSVYAGFHGPVGYSVNDIKGQRHPRRMYPSPMDLILDKREEIIDNIDKYVNKAQKLVSKEV